MVVEVVEVRNEAPQASDDAGVLNTGEAGQLIVALAPTPLITGAVLSITLIVWLRVELLLHPSWAVQVRCMLYAPPQKLVVTSFELSVRPAVLQASVAVALLNTGVAGHCTVSAGELILFITGAVLSITLIVWLDVVVLPQASTAVHVRTLL